MEMHRHTLLAVAILDFELTLGMNGEILALNLIQLPNLGMKFPWDVVS